MNLVAAPTKLQIQALQSEMQAMDTVEPEVKHTFAPGVYMREMLMPKGLLVVGKTHAHEHICIVSKGHIRVASEDGHRDLKAGDSFVAPVGAKRVLLALEDSVFINVHHNPDNERDPEALEQTYITPELLEGPKK